MSELRVHLFGKLSVSCSEGQLDGLSGAKAQELFSYLMLHRRRPHPREALANLLWPDASTAQSKKYLRQALWQLNASLRCSGDDPCRHPFLVDADWVQVNAACRLWLDVEVLEQSVEAIQGLPTTNLDADLLAALKTAVGEYRGDLLEGWYHDWCLPERQRLQEIYLAALDKLIAHSESESDFESALRYATLSLTRDRARECTHRWLMQLHRRAGDRAAALRQYDRCIIALDEELGVKPSPETEALYESIRRGRDAATTPDAPPTRRHTQSLLTDVLARLRQFETQLADIHKQVATNIAQVEAALQAEPPSTVQEPRHAPLRVRPINSPARRATVSRAGSIRS